ncbi:hypothetical protein BCAR13_310057 [Paraburkholderia caribensis]|nr:hypothetical protein BCAR13_310057 [Paraburkholderia caribensis]
MTRRSGGVGAGARWRARPPIGHRLRFDITEWAIIKEGLAHRVYAVPGGHTGKVRAVARVARTGASGGRLKDFVETAERMVECRNDSSTAIMAMRPFMQCA